MEINRIDIAEFRSHGYLQELNRQFLHPLGLALEVIVNDDGKETLGGIWDYRGDEEGIAYGKDMTEHEKWLENSNRIIEEQKQKRHTRERLLGFYIQPVE